MKSQLIAAAAAVSVLAGGTLVATPNPAHALFTICKTYKVSATGSRRLSNAIAKTSAKLKWRAKVIGNLSLPWAYWLRAKNRTLSCSKSGSKWRCTAAATPCRLP